jgi:hypothetical protein
VSELITEDDEDPVDMFGASLREQAPERDAAHELLQTRARAYARVFGHARAEDLKVVMDDLAQFCRAFESTFHDNERHAGRLDGRREVWLRIMKHTRLPHDVLFDHYFRR